MIGSSTFLRGLSSPDGQGRKASSGPGCPTRVADPAHDHSGATRFDIDAVVAGAERGLTGARESRQWALARIRDPMVIVDGGLASS